MASTTVIKAMDLVSRVTARVEGTTLVLLAVLGGLCAAFISLADEVVEGETHAIDTRLLLSLRADGDTADPLGPPWIEEMARDLTALGGVAVLSIIFVSVAVFLWLKDRRKTVVLLAAATGGGLLASTLFKLGFDRSRPDLVPYGSEVYTASFPSGHSMMAAVVWLTLAALVARGEPRRRVKAWIMAIACFVTVAVGLSRVYLGVHWPTDVLAGWAAGAAWALGCLALARFLSNRGALEAEAGSESSDDEGPPQKIEP